MNKEFLKAGISVTDDLGSWFGQWLLYDGGLCVNRTLEEHIETDTAFAEGYSTLKL